MKAKKNGTKGRPVGEEEGADLQHILDGMIDENYLIERTGTQDLASIRDLSLKIDTTFQSIFQLSDFIPKLETLVLDNSTISTIRDLGVGLRNISLLSLANCGLCDLDGIGVFLGLKELNVSNNIISDVSPLAMHDQLETLNLSGNKIVDVSTADSLSSCSQLKELHLEGNPVEKATYYRLIIASSISNLSILDGQPVDPKAASKVTNAMILEAAASMKLVEEEMADELRLEMDCILDANLPGRPSRTSNPSSVRHSYGQGNASGSAASPGLSAGAIPDTGSELTHGSSVVLAGNAAVAMRKRRGNKQLGTNAAMDSNVSSSEKKAPKSFDNEDSEDDCNYNEYDSALDFLDSAMANNGNNAQKPYMFTSFFREGDITAQDPKAKSQMRPEGGEFGPTSSESPLRRPRTSSAKSKNQSSTALSQASLQSSAEHLTNSGDTSFRKTGQSFDLATSAGSNPFSKSKQGVSSNEDNPIADCIEIVNNIYTDSQSEPLSSRTNSRPSSSRGNSSINAFFLGSPRQMNSSRPHSAADLGGTPRSGSSTSRSSSTSSSAMDAMTGLNSGGLALAAPFKVSATREVLKSAAAGSGNSQNGAGTAMAPTGTTKGFQSSIVHKDIVRRGGNRSLTASGRNLPFINAGSGRAGIAMPSVDDSDDDDAPLSRDSKKGIANLPSASVRVRSTNAGSDDDSGSDDLEDIAITHAARHKLMSSSSRRNTSMFRKNQNMLFGETTNDSSLSKEALRTSLTSTTPSHMQTYESAATKVPIMVSPRAGDQDTMPAAEEAEEVLDEQHVEKQELDMADDVTTLAGGEKKEKFMHTVSSMAGICLGFNLPGSLKAIEQWVEEMPDGEDSSDESDNNRLFRAKGNTDYLDMAGSLTASAPQRRLFTEPLATNIERSDRGGMQTDPTAGELHMASPRTPRNNLGDKILSRNAIINMCSSGVQKGTMSTPRSNDVDGGSAHSQTQTALHSEAPVSHQEVEGSPTTNSDSDLKRSSGDNAWSNSAQDSTWSVAESKHKSPVTKKHALPKLKIDTNQAPVPSSSTMTGKAVNMPDEDLVELLRRPPKTTQVLRTKGNFQEFFKGMNENRMLMLLQQAYSVQGTEEEGYSDESWEKEKALKIKKRMDILKEVLI